MDEAAVPINWVEILQPAAVAIMGVLGTLVSAILVQVLRRYGIELNEQKRAAVDRTIASALLMVEERSAALQKRTGHALSADEKRAIALHKATQDARSITRDANMLSDRIEAVLPTVGLGALAERDTPNPTPAQG